MSTVSVIVPCHGHGRHLAGCVESVLGQAGVDVRVLVIDDASRDDTAAIAAGLAAGDGRVESRRHEVDRGRVATYNEGLGWSTGDYTLLLPADGLLTPGALARSSRLMDDHPEVAMVYGRQVLFRPDEPPPSPREPGPNRGPRVIPGSELIESICAAGANPVAIPTVLVRTSTQGELGGYRAELPRAADLELWLRFASRASVGVVAADQALKRVHSRDMPPAFLATTLGDIRQRRSAFEAFFAARGDLVAGRARLERRAREGLASEAFWAGSLAFEAGDLPRSEGLIAFALETDPALRTRAEWSRYRWKRRMGPRVWNAVGPLLDRARRARRPRPPAGPARADAPPPAPGQPSRRPEVPAVPARGPSPRPIQPARTPG